MLGWLYAFATHTNPLFRWLKIFYAVRGDVNSYSRFTARYGRTLVHAISRSLSTVKPGRANHPIAVATIDSIVALSDN